MTVIGTGSKPPVLGERVESTAARPIRKATLRDLRAKNPTRLYSTHRSGCAGIDLSWEELGGDVLDREVRRRQRPGYESRQDTSRRRIGGAAPQMAQLVEVTALAISSTDCQQECRRRPADLVPGCPTASCST